jgi:hypothetical protein
MLHQPIARGIGTVRTRYLSGIRGLMLIALVIAGARGHQSSGQSLPTAEARASSGAFVGFGGMKTHIEDFNYNALGVNAGLFIQPHRFFGAEVRGGTYPLYARFDQAPVSAGLLVSPRWIRPGRLQPYAYFGGGMSKSQNAGPHYVATPARWSPCWQASEGLDIPFGRFRFKVYEATWTETYSPVRDLGSFSLSSGLVYTLR